MDDIMAEALQAPQYLEDSDVLFPQELLGEAAPSRVRLATLRCASVQAVQ